MTATLEALGGIEVVFDNAGIGCYGIQELFGAHEMHRVLDVNVHGVQRVMRAVLPRLRAQGFGTIVYASSLIGRVSIPLYATSCASKWALEAIAQPYRAELARFGIDFFIVEPGALPTACLESMLTPSGQSDDYAPETAARAPSLNGMIEWLRTDPDQGPQMVAGIVADIIDVPPGKKPFRVGADRSRMGEGIASDNEALGQVTRGIYTANGMEEDVDFERGPDLIRWLTRRRRK